MSEQGILLKSGTNEMELLTVFVDDQPFGMNVAKVQSIQQYDPDLITALPVAQPGVKGMYLYRDRTIPLLDLAQILGIEFQRKFDQEIIVVTEFNNSLNSFRVQGVKRIYRISWEKLVPLDKTFKDNTFFTGSVNIDASEIFILDLEHILANIFPALMIEAVEKETIQRKETVARDQLEIIFAEDSPTIRKGVVQALKKSGFENVADFINGEEALNHIKKQYEENTEQKVSGVVLISDIEMPRMDGLTLCRQIKQDTYLKDIYVIMFSSLINKQMIEKCKNVEADKYVTKPETNKLIKLLDTQCK